MPPPPPSPSTRPPPLRPLELPLPSALLPPKKRRVLRTPPQATTPIPPPPLPVPAAAGDLAAPVPAPPRQRDAGLTPAADQKPSLPPTRAVEKPSLPPPPTAGKPSSSPPPPPPPPLPVAAGEKPSARPRTDAAANPAPTRKVRRIVKKVVSMGTITPRKAAAAVVAAAAAADSTADGVLQPGEGHATDKSPTDRNGAVDELVGKDQNLGETAVQKPATGCNSVVVCESETLLDDEMVGGGTGASESAMDCSGASEVENLSSRDEERDEVGMSEWQRRRMTEVFVGGLHRDAKEKDVRAVLTKAGQIAEVRMIMDPGTKKNKGYCFVRYHEPAQARKAIAESGNFKICGKLCRVAALEGNDKIFLGNIDKKWKKEDIMKLLQKIRVENIDVVTLMGDYNNPGCNRGFAFLEFETYRDAKIAYRKLSRKDVFDKGLNIRVAWAESLNDPDEKKMHKVKAIFVEGVPDSWDQVKMTEIFKKYGKIELIVLSRDLKSTKRNDFAFIHYNTHEAAILCLESFDGEQLTEDSSKVNIKVSLAKSDQKGKKNIENHKCCISEEDKKKRLLNVKENLGRLRSIYCHPVPGWFKSKGIRSHLQLMACFMF